MKKNLDSLSIFAQGFVLSGFLTEFVEALNKNRKQSIGEFYSEFEEKLGGPSKEGQNVVFTQGSLLGLLYLMIVFPQQKFNLKNKDLKIDAFGNEWGNPNIEKWNKKHDKNLDNLIRRLRNAISHARVKFHDELEVVFEDAPVKGKNAGKIDFRVRMSLEGLNKFVSKLAVEIDWKNIKKVKKK